MKGLAFFLDLGLSSRELSLVTHGRRWQVLSVPTHPDSESDFKNCARKVLGVLEKLLDLDLPNLRICVTSRPEVDIRDTLERRASHHMSLHDESGQNNDILDYISSMS
jgi:hypothetical protein